MLYYGILCVRKAKNPPELLRFGAYKDYTYCKDPYETTMYCNEVLSWYII